MGIITSPSPDTNRGEEFLLAMDRALTIPSITGWEYQTLQNAYESDDKVSYLVDGIIPEDSLCLLYGQPGSLKTMVVMDLVMTIITGKGWLSGPGINPYCTRQSRVIWIDMDNGKKRLNSRFKAIGRGHKLPKSTSGLIYISFPEPTLKANDPSIIDRLAQDASSFKSKIIVIDNLLSVSGDIDENSPKMRGVMLGLRALVEKSHCSLIVIHHTPKDKEATIYRGHSSIGQYSDLMIHINRSNNTVTMKSTKDRDYPVPLINAKWKCQVTDRTLIWGKFEGIKTSFSPTEKAIMAYVKAHPGCNQMVIVKSMANKLNISESKIRRILLNLIERNSVKEVKKGRRKLYHPK